ncbi:SusC/RagA family TonB-linked outer membrane protein [Fulvivirgaceae bacterium BMA12]|uniref:SusC/RagA family TonB-linked outer membrane protein n=1 Tax=Agaribacillus aureus TaxID=3051825 RepID=A0ABT8L9Q9_9BACT|nr:SusC/RagA family TonB-linked outer membrane protein [Fulvivirgaceae bacterium BMA12]
MQKLLQMAGIIILLCFQNLPSYTQFLASSKNDQPEIKTQETNGAKYLRTALQEMEAKYKVSIMYNSELVKSIKVPDDHKSYTSVENALYDLLSTRGLSFKKLGENFYVIQLDKNAGENLPAKLEKKALYFHSEEMHHDTTVNKLQKILPDRLGKNKKIAIISGKVSDVETGAPIPGVSVLIKGTVRGTITDDQGMYKIRADPGMTLIFSFIGYLSQEIVVGSATEINVSLEENVTALAEIVVIGYGTQQRRDITGSVASVSAKDIKDIPLTNFENAIQGQLAGVQVQEPSGEPGAGVTVRVRGLGSITAGNEPLYVIDGFPVSKNVDIGVQGDVARRRAAFRPPPSNPLSTLNPNDIESIEVLKDASAAAIYGSRGSNGVILITTKRGRKGESKPTIGFDAFFGNQSVANKIDLMNASELRSYVLDSRNNNYLQNVPGADINDSNAIRNQKALDAGIAPSENYRIGDDFLNPDGTDTDWQDLIFDNATLQSYNLSLSGGSEKIGYYVAGGYYSQDGIIEGSGFDRYSFRVNLEADILPKLQVGLNLNPSFTKTDRLPAGSPYFARPPGIVYSALVHSPTINPYNADGTPNQRDNQGFLFTEDGETAGFSSASNPLAIIDAIQDDLNQFRTFGNFYAEYEIIEGLRWKTFVGIDINNYKRTFFRDNTLLFRTATSGEPYGQSSSSQSINWLVENTLSYQKTFNEAHSLSAVAGYTAQKASVDVNQILAENFPDDLVPTISGGQVTNGGATIEEWSLVSFLARANYGYKDRYLLTATIRTDRASRFGEGNKTGVFPSVSAGWRLSEESFVSNLKALSDLKLRASWGKTGNFLIPNYAAIGLLDPFNYVLGDVLVNGIAPSTISNEDLKWEKTSQVDIGLEFGLFEDRIFGVIDWYKSTTSDLLLNVQVPSSLGFTTALQNIGEVENTGWEISLSTRNLVGDFKWSTDFNFATNDNEVTRLGSSGDPILSSGGAGIRHITRIGDAIGSYFGYEVEGIYQTQQEIDNAPVDTQAPDARPGDFKFRDVNGDGVIDPDDRTVVGNYLPDFTWGLNNRFSYKGFDLSILLQGVEGAEVLNLTRRHLGNGEANFNSYAEWNNRWISPSQPGNGIIPRADRQTGNHGNNNRPSSFQVEDASYIRLRNITVGYNLPSEMLGSYVRSLRVYASGTNLFTSTDYLGFNPEVNNQSTFTNVQGEDYGAYPLSKVFTVGVNVTF